MILIMNDEKKLKPTLWRTCRALMNATRLNVLRLAIQNEGALCVRDYARILSISDATASISLRQLNARGLIGVKRDRIKVYYNDEQDRSLPDSIELQKAFATYFAAELPLKWEEAIMTILRAFTHFNRLAILIRLAQGPAYLNELYAAMGVCVKSIYHHLGFLQAAGLIHETRTYHGPSTFELVRPTDKIAATLLDLTLGNAASHAYYYNEGTGRATDKETKAVLKKVNRAEGNPRQNWRETGPVIIKPKPAPDTQPPSPDEEEA